MKKYYNDRATAVKWLLERADRADWWSWAVLTKHNPDAENPDLDDVTARRVFEDLERQGLIESTTATVSSNQAVGVYRLNLSDQEKWTAISKVPGWCRMTANWVWSRLNDPFPVAMVSGVFALIGAFVGAVAAQFIAKLVGGP